MKSIAPIYGLVPVLVLSALAACSSAGQPGASDAAPAAASTTATGTDRAGSTSATGAATANVGEVTMHPGERIELADRVGLRYLRLVNDSRCLPDVQCIWAGDAEIELQWVPVDGSPRAFRLHTGQEPRDDAFGTHRVTLVSLARGPAPAARLRLEPEDRPR